MHVGDQFRYRSAVGETGTFSAHLAVFREAFAVTAFVAESVELLENAPAENLFRPGFLRSGSGS